MNSKEFLVQYIRGLIARDPRSQAEVGRAADMKPQQFSNLLNGKKDVRLDTVDRLAKALNLPPFYLLMSEEDRAIWDQKSADMDTRAQIHKIIEKFPFDELETAKSALLGMLSSLSRQQNQRSKEKA